MSRVRTALSARIGERAVGYGDRGLAVGEVEPPQLPVPRITIPVEIRMGPSSHLTLNAPAAS